jgi:hypothetical protein
MTQTVRVASRDEVPVLDLTPLRTSGQIDSLAAAVPTSQAHRRTAALELEDDTAAKGRRLINDNRRGLHRLSITHKFHSDRRTQRDVSEARHSAPHDGISGRRIVGTCKITAEPRDLDQVVGSRS